MAFASATTNIAVNWKKNIIQQYYKQGHIQLLIYHLSSLQYPIVKSSPYSHPKTFILFSLKCNKSLKYFQKLHTHINTILRTRYLPNKTEWYGDY